MKNIKASNIGHKHMQNVFMLGDGCNFNCKYCLEAHKNSKERFALKWEYIEAYLRAIYSDANPFNIPKNFGNKIHFLGGEPLLYMDNIEKSTELFFELLDQQGYTGEKMLSFATNGYLLDTPRVANYMEKYANNIRIEFSIDGNKKSHDTNRVTVGGEPTYDRVWNNFLNSPVKDRWLRWVLTTNNVSEYFETAKEWLTNGYRWDAHFDYHTDTRLNTEGAKIYADQVKKLIYWYREQGEDFILGHKVKFKQSQFKPQFIQRVLNEVHCGALRCTLDCDGAIVKCPNCSRTAIDRDENIVAGYAYDIDNVNWDLVNRDFLAGDTPLDRYYEDCYRCPIGNFCYMCPFACKILTGTYTQRSRLDCNMKAIRQIETTFFTNIYIYTLLRRAERLKQEPANTVKTESGVVFYDFEENLSMHAQNRTRVYDLLVPKCWALEFMDEDLYDYVAEVTKAVGGNVTPLQTRLYSKEETDFLTQKFKDEIAKYNLHERQVKALGRDNDDLIYRLFK